MRKDSEIMTIMKKKTMMKLKKRMKIQLYKKNWTIMK